jgi:serine/threonine-protein kinase
MDDPMIMKSFQREARALERLAHPNIVPFYGMGESQGFAFLLARFIDGPSLKTILKNRGEKPLSIPESLAYLKAVSAALGYAHRNGVVHCDVKPGNIMVDQGGSIFLTDFGIARHAESTKTSFGGAVGTAYYMAPEQFMEREVTPATDVYALAVVFYEMICGQRPFSGEESELGTTSGTTRRSMLMHAHLRLPPPDPRSFQPDIPPALSAVLIKALAKDPRERYRSTQEFFMAVCEAATSASEAIPDRIQAPEGYEPVSPPPEPVQQPFPSRVKLPGGRPLGIWIAGGVFVIALVAVILIATQAVGNRSNGSESEVGTTMGLTPSAMQALAQDKATEINPKLIFTQAASTLEAELTQEAKTNRPSPTPSKVPTRNAPTPSQVPTQTSPPPSNSSVDAVDMLYEYHKAINNQNYKKAWGMITDYYKSTHTSITYQAFKEFWAAIGRVDILNVITEDVTGNEAYIVLKLQYTFNNGKVQREERDYSLIYFPSESAWLLDDTNFKRNVP